ncbi:deoxyribonuclease-2-beta-like [Plodia interpunctella]|uniref:deoxyribonuclease-2-beta-like n=1 Tax=Plodia interpunctella TaxID=58824 RepID=UPI002367CB75|nr:deoxyribonuclease-2-beta-like [Plodia interpunctella]
MCDVGFIWCSIVGLVCCGYVLCDVEDWASDIRCRDNTHMPVDWWILYKPSRSSLRRGRNYTFLTPYSEGRWETSSVHITSYSMLMNTIAPIWTDELVQKNLAVLIYTERSGIQGSAAKGILMADREGGVWVTHTVPGFPDVMQEMMSFPDNEIENGHLMTCMALDHAALDGIFRVIAQTNPNVQKMQVPSHLSHLLPNWNKMPVPGDTKVVDFFTHDKRLNPILVARKPGDTHCLFEVFAKAKKVIFDIYDRNKHDTFCDKEYGVRQIKAISIKFPGEVHYIENSTDRATFGVSTAAHWQKTGAGPTQYWACIGSYEEPSIYPRGSMLICILNYDVWFAFSNLKLNEPSC